MAAADVVAPAVAETPAIKALHKTQTAVQSSADASLAAIKALKEADKLVNASVRKMNLKAPASAMKHDSVSEAVLAANKALEHVQASTETLSQYNDSARTAIQEHTAAIKAAKKAVDKTVSAVLKAEAAASKKDKKPPAEKVKKEKTAKDAAARTTDDAAASKKAAAKAKREAAKAAKAAAQAAEMAAGAAAAAAASDAKPKKTAGAQRVGGKKRGRAAAVASSSPADDEPKQNPPKRRQANKYHTMLVDYSYPAADEDKALTCSFDTKRKFAYKLVMCDGFPRDVWSTVEPTTLKQARADFKALLAEYANQNITIVQHKVESHADQQFATSA